MASAILTGVALLAVPAAAQAVGVEVVGGVLRVSLGPVPGSAIAAGNGVLIKPLPGGDAIVSLHGTVNSGDETVGAGCQSVATSNAATMLAPYPGSGSATFAATCSLSGVRVVEGRLRSHSNPQGWVSSLNLPTKVTSTSNTPDFAGQGGDMILTGPAGDLITGGTRERRHRRRQRALQGPGGVAAERQRRPRRPEPEHHRWRRRQRHVHARGAVRPRRRDRWGRGGPGELRRTLRRRGRPARPACT